MPAHHPTELRLDDIEHLLRLLFESAPGVRLIESIHSPAQWGDDPGSMAEAQRLREAWVRLNQTGDETLKPPRVRGGW